MNKVKVNVIYPPEMKTKNKSKLPKDRKIVPKDTNFKVNEIPLGCIDFEMFLKIYDYKYNHYWTNEEIAEEFELDEKNVDDLLFYFKPFNNKIIDKQPLTRSQNWLWDEHYIKMADLLGRDVETQERIPDYKRELQRVEEENKTARLLEEMDELDKETEKEEDERIENMKFKHEIFFIGRQETEEKKKDETVNENDVKNDEIKNEEMKSKKSKKKVKSNDKPKTDNLDEAESKNVKNNI